MELSVLVLSVVVVDANVVAVVDNVVVIACRQEPRRMRQCQKRRGAKREREKDIV